MAKYCKRVRENTPNNLEALDTIVLLIPFIQAQPDGKRTMRTIFVYLHCPFTFWLVIYVTAFAGNGFSRP